ncbi:hypothetical protein [Flammeovirga aprica]|uniref:Lipoprotein n=1 Tax=Flammeovirga aprica JL-4 TaxID=694437 RepID=A0A7X9RSV6_9BACT|nr:hypothetical protein [Flammeovirga aprica]NME66484.1 hypothetical protein [Flammeovirga aprica JL-4]
MKAFRSGNLINGLLIIASSLFIYSCSLLEEEDSGPSMVFDLCTEIDINRTTNTGTVDAVCMSRNSDDTPGRWCASKDFKGSYSNNDRCQEDREYFIDYVIKNGGDAPSSLPNGPDVGNDSGSDGGSGSTYDWSYTCSHGGGGTVPITDNKCQDKQKAFAQAYGCNDYSKFSKVCREFYGCIGADTSGCP